MRNAGGHNRYDLPATLTESAGSQLGAFGVTAIPGARINTVDPPSRGGAKKKVRAPSPPTSLPPFDEEDAAAERLLEATMRKRPGFTQAKEAVKQAAKRAALGKGGRHG